MVDTTQKKPTNADIKIAHGHDMHTHRSVGFDVFLWNEDCCEVVEVLHRRSLHR